MVGVEGWKDGRVGRHGASEASGVNASTLANTLSLSVLTPPSPFVLEEVIPLVSSLCVPASHALMHTPLRAAPASSKTLHCTPLVLRRVTVLMSLRRHSRLFRISGEEINNCEESDCRTRWR
jgi:hypothetical protein